MGGLFGGGGGGTTVVNNTTPAPTQDELDLIGLNKQLATKQLAQFDQLAPYQQQLLQLATGNLTHQSQIDAAINSAITPQAQAKAALDQFNFANESIPIQRQLQQMQLDQLKNGGAATPEQLARIHAAGDAAITAGTGDIDTQTSRGIGLISDELANSRGLRLSDAPIGSEAALLVRAAGDQKSSLINNVRSGEAASALNYPLAVQQMQSGINLSQQNLASATQNFQDQLRQQAYQNRLALSGSATSGGLGLASIGGVGSGALGDLTSARLGNRSSSTNQQNTSSFGQTLSGLGSLASGIGAIGTLFSDRRLKADVVKIGDVRPGIGLYEYRYKGHEKRHVGVMADEVEKVLPHAVIEHETGYKAVKYHELTSLPARRAA